MKSGTDDRLLIQALGPWRLRNLLFALAAVLAVYCLYYVFRDQWWVVGGGALVAASLAALGSQVALNHTLPRPVVVVAALSGVNLGAAIAVSALQFDGVAWIAPLVLANLLLGGPVTGSVFSAITIVVVTFSGDLYLDPDLTANLLGALLLSMLMALAISRSLSRHVDRLESEAHHDPLTGAVNRAGLTRSLDERLPRVDGSRPLALILFDLDHFKKLNDEYGHTAGDAVLQSFVQVLNENLRRADSVFRYGGEEFVVLVDGDADAGLQVAEKLRTAVEQDAFLQSKQVTVSAGIAEATPSDTERTVISRADKALYDAKHGGRNCCRCATAVTP